MVLGKQVKDCCGKKWGDGENEKREKMVFPLLIFSPNAQFLYFFPSRQFFLNFYWILLPVRLADDVLEKAEKLHFHRVYRSFLISSKEYWKRKSRFHKRESQKTKKIDTKNFSRSLLISSREYGKINRSMWRKGITRKTLKKNSFFPW